MSLLVLDADDLWLVNVEIKWPFWKQFTSNNSRDLFDLWRLYSFHWVIISHHRVPSSFFLSLFTNISFDFSFPSLRSSFFPPPSFIFTYPLLLLDFSLSLFSCVLRVCVFMFMLGLFVWSNKARRKSSYSWSNKMRNIWWYIALKCHHHNTNSLTTMIITFHIESLLFISDLQLPST